MGILWNYSFSSKTTKRGYRTMVSLKNFARSFHQCDGRSWSWRRVGTVNNHPPPLPFLLNLIIAKTHSNRDTLNEKIPDPKKNIQPQAKDKVLALSKKVLRKQAAAKDTTQPNPTHEISEVFMVFFILSSYCGPEPAGYLRWRAAGFSWLCGID